MNVRSISLKQRAINFGRKIVRPKSIGIAAGEAALAGGSLIAVGQHLPMYESMTTWPLLSLVPFALTNLLAYGVHKLGASKKRRIELATELPEFETPAARPVLHEQIENLQGGQALFDLLNWIYNPGNEPAGHWEPQSTEEINHVYGALERKLTWLESSPQDHLTANCQGLIYNILEEINEFRGGQR